VSPAARTSAVARRYARALLEVATERGAQDEAGQEIAALGELFEQDPMLRLSLTDPMVPQGRREEILQALLEVARPREELARLLRQMLAYDRMGRVTEVAAAYRQLMDEQRGIVEVEVATASALTAAQRKRLSAALEKMTGKKVRLTESLDPGLLGGVLARIGDKVYDASVQGRLRQIREEMEGAAGS